MPQSTSITRRRLCFKAARVAAGAIALPYFLPSSVLGKSRPLAPGSRITIGCIGTGGRGIWNMRAFMAEPDVQILAVCDVDAQHREKARVTAGLPPKSSYNDFRQLLARNDIDAVIISTPDHWHVPIAVAAAKAAKDIFCEKPLTHTIAEGRALCNVVKQYTRVFQTGSQQRSDGGFRLACQLVRAGHLGRMKIIKVGLPGSRAIAPQPLMPVPQGFDYDMWLGPAPWKPYTKARCHGHFRHIFDYSGGKFIDWGAHHLDIVQLALRADHSGPVEIAGTARFPKDGIYNTALVYSIDFKYADGTKVNASTYHQGGIRFEGTEGSIFVNRGVIDAQPKSLLKKTRLPKCDTHIRNFLDSVKLRKGTVAPAEVGHRSATVCHLGNIAMLLARKLIWDPKNEVFPNDHLANRMTTRTRRAPWKL